MIEGSELETAEGYLEPERWKLEFEGEHVVIELIVRRCTWKQVKATIDKELGNLSAVRRCVERGPENIDDGIRSIEAEEHYLEVEWVVTERPWIVVEK